MLVPNLPSGWPSLSPDGRYVAFESVAGDLAPGDAPGWKDIFRRDLQLGVTELVSAGASGAVPNGASQQPSISADGSRVAFESTATNLGPPDTGPTRDVYVRDLVTGVTTMASLKSTGGQSILGSSRPALSADGTMVAFEGSGLVPLDLNGATDVHVRDLVAGTTTRVSTDGVGREGNGYSTDPAISADGRFVAFSSVADNLLLEDHAPWPYRQVYVKDRSYGTTYLVSPTPTGAYGNQASNLPAISADGGQVAFDSYASNLVPGDGNDSQDVFLGGDPVRGLDVLSDKEFTFRATDDLEAGDYDLRIVRADGEQALERGAFSVEASRTYAGDCSLQTVFFDFDESSLTNDTRRLLADNARCIESRGYARVRLECHADERGSTIYNLSLGQRRADAVRKYLLNIGVGSAEVGTLSYGEERPLESGSSESAWAKNRRVEFVIQ